MNAALELLTEDETKAPTMRPHTLGCADGCLGCEDDERARKSFACSPACFCVPATVWTDRKYNGTWDPDFDSVEGGALESRTCLCCGATLTREVAQ